MYLGWTITLQKKWIEAKVADSTELSGTQVRIDVKDGTVALSGQVRFMAQKMLYEEIAWRAFGAVRVEDEIRRRPCDSVRRQGYRDKNP
jgi:osmotically-inducible protein OsmY